MAVNDFSSRLHQLATGQASLNTLITEGNSYLSTAPIGDVDKWEREARKRKWLFTNNPSYLDEQQFTSEIVLKFGSNSDGFSNENNIEIPSDYGEAAIRFTPSLNISDSSIIKIEYLVSDPTIVSAVIDDGQANNLYTNDWTYTDGVTYTRVPDIPITSSSNGYIQLLSLIVTVDNGGTIKVRIAS